MTVTIGATEQPRQRARAPTGPLDVVGPREWQRTVPSLRAPVLSPLQLAGHGVERRTACPARGLARNRFRCVQATPCPECNKDPHADYTACA
jgi:hypothetical protein